MLSPDGEHSAEPIKRSNLVEPDIDLTTENKVDAACIQKIIKESLQDILPSLFNDTLKNINEELSNARQEISELREAVQTLQDKVERLEKRSDASEQESRLSSLILINEWPESKTESTLTMASNYIQEVLKIDIHDNDIIKCHRIGKKREPGRPRPVLIKFGSVSLKTEVFTARRRLRKFVSLDHPKPVYINEDLTEPRRAIYTKCRDLKKKNRIKDCWTQAGRVFIKLLNDQVCYIESDRALDDI